MLNQARYMDAVRIGREEEKKNTEKQTQRAIVAEQRADAAESQLLELQKQVEELKQRLQ